MTPEPCATCGAPASDAKTLPPHPEAEGIVRVATRCGRCRTVRITRHGPDGRLIEDVVWPPRERARVIRLGAQR